MSENANSPMLTHPVGRLMGRYAVPCVISLLVAALYNIVDQIFIANASYLGSYGNAANTVVFPLTVVALGIAVMIGDGCCAFVSICLGSGDSTRAHKAVGNAVAVIIAASVVITALYLVFQDGILTFFGGRVNPETWRNSKEYFFWISLGLPFYMFGQAMNPVIRSDGSPIFAMASTLAGAVINIILDPIFIFVCKWGMMGAAVATVIGQIATAILAAWYLFHTRTVKLSAKSFVPDPHIAGRVAALGACSFLAQISLVAAMAAIQNMVVKYGARHEIFGLEGYAQIPMAVLGIVMKFFQIVISIVIGIAAGCIPIVGYNIGAHRRDRAKGILIRLMAAEVAVGLVALLIAEFLPRQLISLFGAAGESPYYTEFAVKSFRCYLCMVVLACVNKAAFIYLQSLGEALLSTMLSMVREVVFGVGFALLLPLFMGLDGVLWSMPVSDVVTFIISMIVLRHIWKVLSA